MALWVFPYKVISVLQLMVGARFGHLIGGVLSLSAATVTVCWKRLVVLNGNLDSCESSQVGGVTRFLIPSYLFAIIEQSYSLSISNHSRELYPVY